MIDKTQLIIFDWDGTLMDSEAKIVRCFQRAYEDVGLATPQPDQIKEIIGLGLRESLDTLLPDHDPAIQNAVVERYREHFLVLDDTPMEFFPGVLPGLARLRQWGYRLAVATGKARRGLNRLLDEWQLHACFDVTRCSDESRSKPDPRMLRDILDHTGLQSTEAVMVGDTVFDMQMARSADMPRMAVSYGVHRPQRLMDYDPLSCFDHFEQLLDWFEPR